MIRRYRTIDAHAGGAPLRLVVEGFPSPRGRTMAEKRAWATSKTDGIRRALLLEPRGHADMAGAVLTDPVSDGADAGVLFMHADGFGSLCGHGIIAITTIALEREIVHPHTPGTIVFDTPAGIVRAVARMRVAQPASRARAAASSSLRVERVAFAGVPSFVLAPGVPIRVGARELRVDVAFGGGFYAILDVEAAGLAIVPERLADLRRIGRDIARAVEKAIDVVHPSDEHLRGIDGTVFTAPPVSSDADLRALSVFGDGAVDRSPNGAGTCAVMAVLAAMGLLAPGQAFRMEGPAGTIFTGTATGRTRVGDGDAILPVIEGAAWITGDHIFEVDDDDPLKRGFRF